MLRSAPNHIRTFPDPTPELRAGSRSRIHILGRPQADNTKLRRSAEPSACSLSAAALCLGMNLSFGRSRSSCRLMAGRWRIASIWTELAVPLPGPYRRLRSHPGADFVQEPFEQFWGTPGFVVRQPSGNLARIGQRPLLSGDAADAIAAALPRAQGKLCEQPAASLGRGSSGEPSG